MCVIAHGCYIKNLAEFCRKRDPRVKKYLAEEQKRKEAVAAEQKARAQREKQDLQAKAADYQVPEWAQVDEQDMLTEEEEEDMEEEVNEFYCVVCDKGYRSEKQFTTHENSKRHLENVEILRQEMLADEENFDFGSSEVVDPGTPIEVDEELTEQMENLEVEEQEIFNMTSSSKKNKKKNKKKAAAAPRWGYDEEDIPESMDDIDTLNAALEEERSRRRRKGGNRAASPAPVDTPSVNHADPDNETEATPEKESAKTKREKRKEKKKAKEESEALTEVIS